VEEVDKDNSSLFDQNDANQALKQQDIEAMKTQGKVGGWAGAPLAHQPKACCCSMAPSICFRHLCCTCAATRTSNSSSRNSSNKQCACARCPALTTTNHVLLAGAMPLLQAGDDIIDALCKSSATFDTKTEYAQHKYKKRKARKYLVHVTVRRPTARLMCQVRQQGPGSQRAPCCVHWSTS